MIDEWEITAVDEKSYRLCHMPTLLQLAGPVPLSSKNGPHVFSAFGFTAFGIIKKVDVSVVTATFPSAALVGAGGRLVTLDDRDFVAVKLAAM